jgi:hypothetical protein
VLMGVRKKHHLLTERILPHRGANLWRKLAAVAPERGLLRKATRNYRALCLGVLVKSHDRSMNESCRDSTTAL